MNPNKKTIEIDGKSISVVPHGENKFDAWGGGDGISTNMPEMKARQIRAIELVSGCKVTAAEYLTGTPMLQTLVSCFR